MQHIKKWLFIGESQRENRKQLKVILTLTVPAFLELFLTSFFNVVDQMMVGRLSPAAISGVGLTNQPMFLLMAVFQAVNIGTMTLVSWSIGEKDYKRAGHIVKQTILLNVGMGLVLMTLGRFIAAPLMGVMSEDPLTVKYATQYLTIMCYSLCVVGVTMGITAALRGCGHTLIPMVYNIVANATNVLMNYALIYGNFGMPRLEVEGAAIATAISRVIACVFALYVVLFWKKSPVRVSIISSWKPDFAVIKKLMSIGLPAAGEQFVIQSGLMLFSRIVSSLGTNHFAAHQIVAGINSMALSVSQSFSVSTTSLVGRFIGADDFKNAENYANMCRNVARLSSVMIAGMLVLLARPLASLYTDVAEVIDLAVPVFFLIAAIQFVQSSQMSTSGALRGAGDTMFPLYATIIGIWGLRVVMAALFIFVFKWGIIGAWTAFFIDQSVRNLIVLLRFRSGKWKGMKAKKIAKDKALRERLGTKD